MKPKRLEFCGINSFSERAVVDFDALLAGGIFGIFGDTGSGKTTILDSMIFALYGKIDRTRGGNGSEIVNYRCDKASVTFDFECEWEGKRRVFRVEREIKKKNSLQALELCELDGDTVRPVSEGVKKTNEKILEIVGLSFDDFKKCIALPQGEFAQFVKADRGERLRLISRLFDLERYGDRLNAAVKARLDAAKSELDKKSGEITGYAAYTEQALSEKKAEAQALSAQMSGLEEAFEDCRARFEKCKADRINTVKLREKREALRAEEEKNGEFAKLSALLAVLPAAGEIAARSEKLAKTRKEIADAAKKESEASKSAVDAGRELAAVKEAASRADYTAAIAAVKAKQEQMKAAAADAKERGVLLEKRGALAAKYKEEEKKKAELSKELAAAEKALLKCVESEEEADLSKFLRENLESALLADEYAAEQAYAEKTLSSLRTGFPAEGALYFAAERELASRAEHFRALREKEKNTDASALLARYKEEQEKRRGEREKRHALELARVKAASALRESEKALADITEKGTELKQRADALTAKIRETAGEDAARDPEGTKTALAEKEKALIKERENSERRIEALQGKIIEAREAAAGAGARLKTLGSAEKEESAALGRLLRENGFSSAEEADALVKAYPDPAALAAKIEAHEKLLIGYAADIRSLTEDADFCEVEEETFRAQQEAFSALEKKREETGRALAVYKGEIGAFAENLGKKKALEKERERLQQKYDLTEQLRKLFYGNAFMEFVAGEYLADIASAATQILLRLTNGRYFIRYEQGFFVGDNFNGGELRSVNTLSGGETFLVSLSLALALSAAIYARSLRPIEFFFLDEGFGTLDEKLVDTVMDSLEKLKNTHFSIGLISHVEELKHRIDNKITVISAQENGGSSKIKITC